MSRLIDILGTHWLAISFALAAGVLLALRHRRLPSAFAAFSLGCFILDGWSFRLAEDGPARSVALAGLAVSGLLILFAALVLLVFRRWSASFAISAAGLGLASLGGLIGKPLGSGVLEVWKGILWLQFLQPWWLLLLVFVPAVVLVSRRSLSGLGRSRKWAAIAFRSLVVACLVLALAEPRVRRPSETTSVLFVVDRSFSIPLEPVMSGAGTETDMRWERTRSVIEAAIARRGSSHRNDQVGVIFFGKRPRLAYAAAPVASLPIDEKVAGVVDGNATDIAAALKLAMASFPEGTSKRIVLVSDGNENLGNAAEQAELARRNGIPIDTLALAPGFRNENEVLIQSVDAPPITVQGGRLPVRILIRNAHPTREIDGELEVVRIGRQGLGFGLDGNDTEVAIRIEDGPQVLNGKNPPLVRLVPGLNVFRFRDLHREQAQNETSYTYKANFKPLQSVLKPGDAPTAGLPGDRPNNNRATAAVVARGQRRILFLDTAPAPEQSPHRYLIAKLRDARQRLDHLDIAKLPGDKADLGVFLSNYDCVILANVPADLFTNDQMETIRTQVHDQGCGLVMVGGPDSFGPGGYQQTPVEAALPVDCEIKAKKASGKGGLVLVMHASEMADGNKWQKVIAKLAIQRLGPADMIGVVDYGLLGGTVNWQIPFTEIGDGKESLFAKVDRMSPGDMPDFDPFLKAAADTLSNPKYNLAVKHCIVISDGDPNYSGPGQAAVKRMAENGITCTTVGVATHGVNEDTKMATIAAGTRDANGRSGNFHKCTNPNQLPALYIKETRRVSQSFVYDRTFNPKLTLRGGPADGLPDNLPQLHGFVRTTKKESPLCDMHIEGPMDEQSQSRFPVLASWRYGLGKAVAFTADARSIPAAGVRGWDRDWAGSEIYQKFWEQSVQWAMREAETGKLTLVTDVKDGRVRVTVDARDEKDKPVSGLSLRGAVTTPGKPGPGEKPVSIEFKPKGSGQYEAEFAAEDAGAYFVRVEGSQGGKLFDSARAGVTVPYSPEFSDLETNTPLLKRLSEITGGNATLEPEDLDWRDKKAVEKFAQGANFFRPAPASIRAVLPFWFWLVFAAGVFLFLDIAARRIAIDTDELREWGRRRWAVLRRQPMEEPTESGALDALTQRKRAVGDVLAKKKAAAKFEAEPGLDEPPPTSADEYVGRTSGAPLPPPPPLRDAKPAEADDGEDMMARLRKAKERGKK
jgi:uncharacterized membrane protein